MSKKDPRVDAYIAKSADFAKPILSHIRRVVHGACPDVVETMKWQMPSFTHHGIVCQMAAFKEHCALVFWKRKLIFKTTRETDGLGQFGKIKSLADLPSEKVLLGYVRKAAKLNESGTKVPGRDRPLAAKPLTVPKDLAAALKRDKRAAAVFDGFSPSHRNEYISWITGAKKEETRQRRLQSTLERLAQGKPRNWEYMNC
jgi:uncharacterized protein YdeI (YjbR/CyaY-like superfamily)